MNGRLLVIVNPASGGKKGQVEADKYIIPLLKGPGVDIPIQTEVTTAPEHAGELAKGFISSGAGSDILVIGGDGTIHEVINAVETLGEGMKIDINLIIWPSGTANALYHSLFVGIAVPQQLQDLIPPGAEQSEKWKFSSLLLYLGSQKHLGVLRKPLSVARTAIYDSSDQVTTQILSTVVTSTALHAAILHTAEDLRASIPSLERFQEAARRNVAIWSNASVKILDSNGALSESVEMYNIDTQSFSPLPPAYRTSSPLKLKGPFSYFLSTVNVDRLEEKFEITSLYTSRPPQIGVDTMDIIILRPERDPSVQTPQGDHLPSSYPEEVRQAFASRTAMRALRGAYDKGAHVNMEYPNGEPVAEYFRAGGWEWTPEVESDAAHLVCADGTILHIPPGGKARCQLIPSDQAPRFHIWILPTSTSPDPNVNN